MRCTIEVPKKNSLLAVQSLKTTNVTLPHHSLLRSLDNKDLKHRLNSSLRPLINFKFSFWSHK